MRRGFRARRRSTPPTPRKLGTLGAAGVTGGSTPFGILSRALRPTPGASPAGSQAKPTAFEEASDPEDAKGTNKVQALRAPGATGGPAPTQPIPAGSVNTAYIVHKRKCATLAGERMSSRAAKSLEDSGIDARLGMSPWLLAVGRYLLASARCCFAGGAALPPVVAFPGNGRPTSAFPRSLALLPSPACHALLPV